MKSDCSLRKYYLINRGVEDVKLVLIEKNRKFYFDTLTMSIKTIDFHEGVCSKVITGWVRQKKRAHSNWHMLLW